MKLNNLFVVSIFLLILITFGAVSAADDNSASVTAIDGDLDLEVQAVDEIDADSGVDSDAAICDDATKDDNKLGAIDDSDVIGSTDNDKLSGDVSPEYNLTVNLPMSGSAYVAQWGQPIGVTLDMGNATGEVTMTFADQTYTVPLVNGVATYEITKYSKIANNQKLNIAYGGDDYYASFSTSKNINIKLDELVANSANYGLKPYVEVYLYNATGNVTFTVNGNTYRKELVNGAAVQEFTNYTLGRNTVTFAYEGDENYDPISKSVNFDVNANIDAPTTYNFQPAIINVYLGEATGQVIMSMGSEEYAVDVINGVATQEFENYVVGSNEVTVQYSGDDKFNPFSTSKTFTVLDKENATILSSVYRTADKNMVIVCIPFGTGNVNVTINGKQEILELVDGMAIYNIDATDVISEINVTYAGSFRLNGANSTEFKVLNNVVNAENYMYYFNQADGGKMFGFIEDGTTLDFQGSIINPNQTNNITFNVIKPVNIISTTNDAYIDLNTTAGSLIGENPGNRFTISYGGSGTNMTGINFHNTQLWLSNTHHVVLDRVSNVIEDQRVGSGVGATSIRDNSTWVTVKNSYFYTRNNGGSSSLVIAWADYCTFHNNTIRVEGNVGNMIYLTTYNVEIPEGVTPNAHNNITNNRIFGPEKASSICWGFVVAGSDNLFANNWINYSGVGFNIQWGMGAAEANIYVNNTLIGGASASFPGDSIVYNNYISGTMSTGANSVVYNNTVGKAMTVSAGAEAYNNTVAGLTMSGAGGIAHDNVVNGVTTISQANVIIENNTFLGDNAIKFSNANAKNGIFANNTVVGYIEFGNKNAKNNTITGNNIITSHDYAIDLKTYTGTETVITNNILNSNSRFGDAAINHIDDDTLVIDNYQYAAVDISVSVDPIKVGQNAVFNVVVNETSMTKATVVISGKEYSVDLVDGKGTLEVADLAAGTYNVIVVSADKNFGGQNTTTLDVTKNDPTVIVDAPETVECLNYNVTVNVNDATGTVTFALNGTDTVVPIVNGVAVFTIADLTQGTYDINITYSGDDKYYGNQTEITLNVAKNKNVTIIAHDVQADRIVEKFNATFVNYQGVGIANANVIFKIGNETYTAVTDANGMATISLSLSRGLYPITIDFEAIGDEFDAASSSAVIYVSDMTVLLIDSISTDVITGTLKDIHGNPIANATIVYTIAGGDKLKTTTDGNGAFAVKVDKNGLVTFNFEGDAISEASAFSITLNDMTVLSIDSISTNVITGTLKDNHGNPIANATIVYTIAGGNKLKTTTDGNGAFAVKVDKNGLVTFNFEGDAISEASAFSITLNGIVPAPVQPTKVKKATKIVAKKKAFKAKVKTKKYTIALKTKAGKAIKKVRVTLKIKGKTYKAKTNAKGKATFKIKKLTKRGKYTAKIKFAGNKNFKAASKKVKITVKK